MGRLVWLLAAAILIMGGYDMLLRAMLGWSGYVVAGVGVGIGTSVLGSYAHDLLAGPRERW